MFLFQIRIGKDIMNLLDLRRLFFVHCHIVIALIETFPTFRVSDAHAASQISFRSFL